MQTLIDYLEGDNSIEKCLGDSLGVRRDHAIAVLEVAESALIAKALAG